MKRLETFSFSKIGARFSHTFRTHSRERLASGRRGIAERVYGNAFAGRRTVGFVMAFTKNAGECGSDGRTMVARNSADRFAPPARCGDEPNKAPRAQCR